jgi:hypothetical protein
MILLIVSQEGEVNVDTVAARSAVIDVQVAGAVDERRASVASVQCVVVTKPDE